MSGRNGIFIAIGACAVGLLAGYSLQVFAEGAPTQTTLFYSGTLEQDGAPASGDFTITLTLYDAATGGDDLCEVTSEAAVENGRFRIDASGCADAVREEPNAWAAVAFEGADGMKREIAGRSKIGAVPYALEADHAVNASNPVGALASSLQALTDRVNALEQGSARASAFHAIAKQPQTIPSAGSRYVIFDQEDYDFDNEYDPTTGAFTTKTGGYYEFSCIVTWATNAGVVGTWEASLNLNGSELYYNGDSTDGEAVTRSIHGVMKLNPGDRVQCGGLQDAPEQPLNVDHNYNTFEGRRFAK